jgi:2,3-bisphosphoglycerate-dependent phosphoglycerate mutase
MLKRQVSSRRKKEEVIGGRNYIMSTFVYMVRHGESPKEGNDRTRGLTEKGYLDAKRVTDILKEKEIDVIVSSPYIRSILTVEQLAQQIGEEV